jgi:hypothetical protein
MALISPAAAMSLTVFFTGFLSGKGFHLLPRPVSAVGSVLVQLCGVR